MLEIGAGVCKSYQEGRRFRLGCAGICQAAKEADNDSIDEKEQCGDTGKNS